jgi:hypothetical protein
MGRHHRVPLGGRVAPVDFFGDVLQVAVKLVYLRRSGTMCAARFLQYLSLSEK